MKSKMIISDVRSKLMMQLAGIDEGVCFADASSIREACILLEKYAELSNDLEIIDKYLLIKDLADICRDAQNGIAKIVMKSDEHPIHAVTIVIKYK